MKGSWRLIALAAGGLLLGGAHGAMADHQRSGHDRDDPSDRYQRSGWHSDRDDEQVGRLSGTPAAGRWKAATTGTTTGIMTMSAGTAGTRRRRIAPASAGGGGSITPKRPSPTSGPRILTIGPRMAITRAGE